MKIQTSHKEEKNFSKLLEKKLVRKTLCEPKTKDIIFSEKQIQRRTPV